MKLDFTPKLQYISAGMGAALGAAGSLVGDVANLFGQSAANRQSQKFAMDQMNTQRSWALQDVAAQNKYNSPEAQMARLKSAGLNPNLVYGQGVQGATGAQSSQPRATSTPAYNPQSITTGFKDLGSQTQSAIQQYQDILSQNQHRDSVDWLIENQKKEVALKQAEIIGKVMENNIRSTEPGAITDVESEKRGFENWQTRGYKLNTLAAGEEVTLNQAQQSAVQTAIQEATKQSNIQAAIQAGIQAMIRTTTDQQALTKLKLMTQGQEFQNQLDKLQIDNANWKFNANSPIVQQVLEKILTIAAAYALPERKR